MYDNEMWCLMKSVVYSAQSWIPVLNEGTEACSPPPRHDQQDPAVAAVITCSYVVMCESSKAPSDGVSFKLLRSQWSNIDQFGD